MSSGPHVSPPADVGAAATHANGILTSSRILLVRRVIVTVGSAVATGVIARELPIAQFGVYSAALATFYLASAMCDLGFNQVMARELAQAPSRRAELLSTGTRVASGWALAVAVAFVVFALVSASGTKMATMLVMVPALAFAGATIARQVFIVGYDVRGVAAVDTVTSLAQVGLLILTAVLGGGPVLLALITALTSVVNTVVVAVWARRRVGPPGAGEPGLARDLVRMSLPIGIPSVLASAYFTVDLVLASYLVSTSSVALYAAAVKVLTITTIVPQVLMGVALPGFSALLGQREEAELGDLVGRMWHWLVVVGLGLAVSLAAFAPLVLRILFGPGFEGATGALAVLMVASAIALLSNLLGTLLVAAGLARKMFFQNIAALVLTVGLNLALLPSFGIMAAAWITAVVEIFLASMSLIWVRRVCDWGPARAVSLRPLVAAGSLVGVALLPLGHDAPHAALAGMVYVVVLTALRGWPFDETVILHKVSGAARAAGRGRRPR